MESKKCVTLQATEREIGKLNLIRKINKRKTLSDTLRFLIEQEHEKILNIALNISNEFTGEEASK